MNDRFSEYQTQPFRIMKSFPYIFILILLFSCAEKHHDVDSELKQLYKSLDMEIDRSEDYSAAKEAKIARLKREYDLTGDSRRRTLLLDTLITEYEAYNSDSTLFYIQHSLQRPDIRTIPGAYTRRVIQRADQFAHAGLFADALSVLDGIPRDSLKPELLEDYYSTCCVTYQYLTEYTSEHQTAVEYDKKRSLYSDSLQKVVSPGSFNHTIYVMTEKARRGDSASAIKGLTEHLKKYPCGTREFSILASTLAYIYKTCGEEKDYKRYLALSAISDTQGAVKENMSFREMATVMFEEGDIDRANRYLKKSFADANFYSALMRNAQSSKMLPVIDEAYAARQQSLTSRLRVMVVVSLLLSLFLVALAVYIYKQLANVRKAKGEAERANTELQELSEKLREANSELERRNSELADFNKTKEQYAGLFMEYCSSAISTLQQYQQSLKVAAQGGNRNTLLKKIESTEISGQLVNNFYKSFDEAILNIYPSFVESFNSLLKPEGQSTVKSGELLNTELRLFALIRLGIDDTTKISQFLRCSVSTVYTYRSKMRKRALDPTDFERQVKEMELKKTKEA